jgi:hypothetical protein
MITVKYEEQDYLNAQRLHHRWSKRVSIIIISLVIIATLLSWILWHQGMQPIACGIIGGLIGCFVIYAALQYIYTPWKARRVFRQHKSLQRGHTMSWNLDGIQAKSQNGESFTSWSDFIRWKEGEYLFLLYISDLQFHMLPKRVFSSEQELNDFRAHLERCVHV